MVKNNVFEEKDFVDVYDESGKKLDPVPKSWLKTDRLPAGVTDKAPKGDADKKADKPVEVPDGEPSDDWTHAQLDAYAAKQDPPVDVSGAGNKDEKIALLTPPPAE